jgi:hypothetical protein
MRRIDAEQCNDGTVRCGLYDLIASEEVAYISFNDKARSIVTIRNFLNRIAKKRGWLETQNKDGL